MNLTDENLINLESLRRSIQNKEAYHPLYVKIKLVYTCNLRCVMCKHWRESRPSPLSGDRFKELIAELAQMGCYKIHFTGGEPLLRRDAVDLVAFANERGIRVTMTTNGTLVTKELVRSLIQAGLRGVNISIDSPDRKIHESIRGVKGSWKKATRVVQYFRRYAEKGKINVRVNTVVSRLNYHSLTSMPDFAFQLGADSLNLIGIDDHWTDNLRMRSRDVAFYNQRIAPEIANRGLELGLFTTEDQAYPFGHSHETNVYARKGEYAFGWYQEHPCYVPWFHSLIDFDGLVYICCSTREQTPSLGNLNLNSFSEIWNGPVYHYIRERMQPPRMKQCRRCDDFLTENKVLFNMLNPDEK